jgi:hypothetical protein
MASRACTALTGIRCFEFQYAFQGSLLIRESRTGTVVIVNRFGPRPPESSAQASGTEIEAAGRARVE